MEQLKSEYLFVYSSLRKGFQSGPYHYISQFFTLVSNGKVKGILRDIGSEVVATPTGEGRFLKGELYKLNDPEKFSWAFGQLDEYEGLITEEGTHPLYRRELADVVKEDGNITIAWIYWYNKDVADFPAIPSGDVLEYLSSKNK